MRIYWAGLLTLLQGALWAASFPTDFVEVPVTNVSNPTAMAFAPDSRLFICQQNGALRVVKNGALLATPFVSLTVDSSGERGLLGVAFDPNFATNSFVYVYYTTTATPPHNRISRFTANGDVAAAGSETLVMRLDDLTSATNHNGGAIHFGPDGKLYAAVGENATASHSQTLNNRLGKMLRINADGTIPTDNPFYNTATGDNRAIWALGLRNPFTFAFQPVTGRMFINDVGQSAWEEINDGIAGANFGWPTTEGPTANPSFQTPLYYYPHGSGNAAGCAITGGAFYPVNSQFPADYNGDYFFAEHCNGWIRRLDIASGTTAVFGTGTGNPVDLAAGPDGSLYYLSRSIGLRKVTYSPALPPAIAQDPASLLAPVGAPATFTVTAIGAATLAFQWQRNGVDIGGATFASYTLPSVALTDSGALFRCVVSNGLGNATSNAATLTVTAGALPVASIGAPLAGSQYSGGDTITFSGGASDVEDGVLPAGALSWKVDFHHDDHTHPALLPFSAAGGSFTIPTTGETSANVFFRISLTATDSDGLTHTVTRDVLPRTANLTFATVPTGLEIKLDGQPRRAPFTISAVSGMLRSLEVGTPQSTSNRAYDFVQWSDNGAIAHTVAVPAADTAFTAFFSNPAGDTDGDGIADHDDPDDDNDGVSDANEMADSTNPLSALSVLRRPLGVSSFAGSVRFDSTGRDGCLLSGAIPGLPALFDPSGAVIVFDIGGARRSFTLDAKGRARGGDGTLSLRLKPSTRNPQTKKVEFLGGDVAFKAKLAKGTWSGDWADEGLRPGQTTLFSFIVDVQFNGFVYRATASGSYTSKSPKNGTFKKQ